LQKLRVKGTVPFAENTHTAARQMSCTHRV
jgi:hypothetical protein